MSSLTVWKLANRPNYITNIDKRFPYSEVPHLGEYYLAKIPASSGEMIQHVDYWGEGKVVSEEGIRGFVNSCNVHHQYQLVSSGQDLDCKIPNRIPVLSYTNCDTSSYIRDDSVLIVTVVGGNLSSSCVKDIARIVNKEHGKVIVYGVHGDSQEISELTDELKIKGFTSFPGANLPRELQGLTYYDSHVPFLNNQIIKEEWYNHVVNSNYDVAVNVAKNFDTTGDVFIKDIVTRLISSAPRNVMSLAYKLWNGGAKDIVRNYFPPSFKLIFNEDAVTIFNRHKPLILNNHIDSDNDREAWATHHRFHRTNTSISWKLLPVWDQNGVTFKLYSIYHDAYLKLDVNIDNMGDRKAWGSPNSNEVRYRYYLEPLVKNDTVMFFIINCQYNQALKLDARADAYWDNRVWGHNGSVYEDDRFKWIIAAF